MKIQSIFAAALASACLLQFSPVIAEDEVEIVVIPVATEGANNLTNESAPKAKAEKEAMTITAQPVADVRIRSGRMHADGRRDARACLNQASNPAIIKCAEKYRYR